MRKFWFAVILLLVLGVLAGLYDQPSITGLAVVNLPPYWDYATDDFVVDGSFELDLNNAFFDPDDSPLSFGVQASEGIAVGLRGSVLVAEVFDDGSIWVTASDGTYRVVQRLQFRT